MAEISGLSVRVSAAVSQFTAGMSRAEDAAGDLALSLRRLDVATDSVERGLDSAGRSATTTAIHFSGLSVASSVLSTRIFGLSAAMWGVLIPALGVLSTALAPLIAGFGGFLAIAGAITGIGLVSVIGAVATQTQLLKGVFTDIVATIEDEFAPVFDLAAEVLVVLMQEFQNIIPELVPAQDALSQIAAAFLNLGTALIDVLPALSRVATELALRFLPPFVEFTERVLPGLPGFILGLADAFVDILPVLFGFGRWFNRIAPDLMDFGMTVLTAVANGLGVVGDAIGEVLSIGASSESLTEFIRRMVTSAATWIQSEGLPLIAGIATDIIDQLETFFEEGGSDRLSGVVSSMMGSLAASLGAVTDKDINKVANQLSIVLGGVMQSLRTSLQSDEAGALGTEISRLAGTVIGVVFDEMVDYAESDQFAQDIAVLSTAIASGLAKGITIATSQALEEIDLQDVARAGAQFGPGTALSPIIGAQISQRTQAVERDPSEFRQQAREIIIEVTGDTGVIEDVAARQVDEEQRRTRRNQGRRPNPTS